MLSLLVVLGLDQQTTQAHELDDLEVALVCVACRAEREPGLFSWREFVSPFSVIFSLTRGLIWYAQIAHYLEMEGDRAHTPSVWRGAEEGHKSHFMV